MADKSPCLLPALQGRLLRPQAAPRRRGCRPSGNGPTPRTRPEVSHFPTGSLDNNSRKPLLAIPRRDRGQPRRSASRATRRPVRTSEPTEPPIPDGDERGACAEQQLRVAIKAAEPAPRASILELVRSWQQYTAAYTAAYTGTARGRHQHAVVVAACFANNLHDMTPSRNQLTRPLSIYLLNPCSVWYWI
jgi:hypothetical protein